MEIVKRLIFALILFFVVSLVVFLVMHKLPGDPILMWLGTEYDASLYDSLAAKYGLDKPLITQYWIWLKNVLHGDFGKSLLTHTPIADEVMRRIPVTVELILLAMCFATGIGIVAGIASAMYNGRFIDHSALTFTLFGISMPEFLIGAILMLLFALHWQIVPPSGHVSFLQDWKGNLHHMLIPAIALGFPRSAVICRMMRSSLLEVFGKNYVRTAIAKGCKTREVLMGHALKNALISVVTVIGLQIGYLVGGSIIIEQLFVIPGVGSFGINALMSRDYPGIQGFIMVVAFFFVFSNLFVDLSYLFLDPRIRNGIGKQR